ncbi:L,D-transpeptidase family protein [Bifidobacterium cuniculi]|uniref:Exported protein n=1 Tax=Bifidobacterium cuniculi TaxID=1688 RepID=A0A087B4B6_9BIFI|nr:L,D-transpeptidase family protein [Bifidobacterium cuniculi]KFI65866.1 exported protein [Bifidobacterium cuniculi]
MTFPSHGNDDRAARQGNVPHASATADTEAFMPLDDSFPGIAPAPARKHHVWPWVLTGVIVLLAAVCFGCWAFFQGRALPGTTLWGHSMTGKTQQQIADLVTEQVDRTTVPVEYDGKTVELTAKELGISVDAEQVAKDTVDAKRTDNPFARYAFWVKQDVNPAVTADTTTEVLDEHLGTASTAAQDATLKVSEDGKSVTVQAAVAGSGADPAPVDEEAVKAVRGLGDYTPQTVEVKLKQIDPAVGDEVANKAKDTINTLLDKGVDITVKDHAVASFDAATLLEAARIEPDEDTTLADGETRNGVVVFSADKLQDAYEQDIKPNLTSSREDREVIVNNNDEEVKVITEGHDGVKLADGADAQVGQEAAAALADGNGTIELAGEVDPMQVKKTKRHVVVDLSDHKVYAYENGKQIRAMNMSAGQGNDYETGVCNSSGDLCTPEGDFEVWLKYPSQHMSGTLTLSDGTKETWDAPDVGFVNYFSKTGCAIHRIATSSPTTGAQIAAMGANTSHGCVGIGWDDAEWFYDWCVMGDGVGTTVHVQR